MKYHMKSSMAFSDLELCPQCHTDNPSTNQTDGGSYGRTDRQTDRPFVDLNKNSCIRTEDRSMYAGAVAACVDWLCRNDRESSAR